MLQFKVLMPANVLRGLGDGAGAFAMAVGMKKLGLSFEYAGYTTALTYFAGLAATLLVGLTVDRFGAGRVIPKVSVLLAIGLMGMVLTTNTMAFLAFFLLWQIMLTMEGLCVPLVHYSVVPVEVIGAFSGIRLLTLTLMMGLSNFIVGNLLEHVSPVAVYGVCASIKLAAGIMYWYGVKVVQARQAVAAEETSVLPARSEEESGDASISTERN
jgi:MFS family permease